MWLHESAAMSATLPRLTALLFSALYQSSFGSQFPSSPVHGTVADCGPLPSQSAMSQYVSRETTTTIQRTTTTNKTIRKHSDKREDRTASAQWLAAEERRQDRLARVQHSQVPRRPHMDGDNDDWSDSSAFEASAPRKRERKASSKHANSMRKSHACNYPGCNTRVSTAFSLKRHMKVCSELC